MRADILRADGQLYKLNAADGQNCDGPNDPLCRLGRGRIGLGVPNVESRENHRRYGNGDRCDGLHFIEGPLLMQKEQHPNRRSDNAKKANTGDAGSFRDGARALWRLTKEVSHE